MDLFEVRQLGESRIPGREIWMSLAHRQYAKLDIRLDMNTRE